MFFGLWLHSSEVGERINKNMEKIYSNGTPFSDKQWKQWYQGKIEGISNPEFSDAEKDYEAEAMRIAEENQ